MKEKFNICKNILKQIDQQSKKLLLLSFSLGLVWFLLELSFVYILQSFLSSLGLISTDKLQIPNWLPTTISVSMILLICFGIVRAVVNYMKSYFSILAMQSSIRHCRIQFIEKGLDSKYFNSTSDYQTTFFEKTNQTGIFVQYLSIGSVSLFAVGLFFIFGLFYAPKEMIFSLTVTLVLMAPVKKFAYIIQSTAESLISEWNGINSKVVMNKKNLFFLMVYDLIDIEKKELTEDILRYEKHYDKFASASSLIASVPLLVGIVVLSACSYLSIQYFYTPGIKVLSFFYIFLRMTQGLSELNGTYAVLKLNYPSFRDVHLSIDGMNSFEILRNKSKGNELVQSGAGDKRLKITFDNVAFGYPGSKKLFNGFDLELNIGDVFIIKGPSGAGKSTLLKLLLGIEQPINGMIKFNDKLIQDLDASWKTVLGYVGPEPFMIPGTLRENLHFGNRVFKIDDHLYNEALCKAGLSESLADQKITLDCYLAESSFFFDGTKTKGCSCEGFFEKSSSLNI